MKHEKIPAVIETVKFKVNGQSTCAVSFLEEDEYCDFYRTARMGTVETCAVAPQQGKRPMTLERDEGGAGWLIPGEWCPFWHQEIPSKCFTWPEEGDK